MQALPIRRGIPATTNGKRTSRMIQETCPICAAASARLMGEKHGLRVLRCARVYRAILRASPGDEPNFARSIRGLLPWIAGGYPAYEADESLHRARSRSYLSDLMVHSRVARIVARRGCATGFFLDEARQVGWDVRGCEVSEWASTSAKRRFGPRRRASPLPDNAARFAAV
jgi:hypothetical protein